MKNSALLTSTPRVNSALTKTYMDKNGLNVFQARRLNKLCSIKYAVVCYGHKHEKAIRFETEGNRLVCSLISTWWFQLGTCRYVSMFVLAFRIRLQFKAWANCSDTSTRLHVMFYLFFSFSKSFHDPLWSSYRLLFLMSSTHCLHCERDLNSLQYVLRYFTYLYLEMAWSSCRFWKHLFPLDSSFLVSLWYQAKHSTHTWNSSSTFEGREYPFLPCICRCTEPMLETEQHHPRSSHVDCHVSTVLERFSPLGLPPISSHTSLRWSSAQASRVTEVFFVDALSDEDHSRIKLVIK